MCVAHLSGGLRIWLFSIVGDMGAARASLIALEPAGEVLTNAMDAIVDDRASKGCRWLNYLGLRSSDVLNERNRTSSYLCSSIAVEQVPIKAGYQPRKAGLSAGVWIARWDRIPSVATAGPPGMLLMSGSTSNFV